MIIPDQQQTHPADKALDDLIQVLLKNEQIDEIFSVTADEKIRHAFYRKYNL